LLEFTFEAIDLTFVPIDLGLWPFFFDDLGEPNSHFTEEFGILYPFLPGFTFAVFIVHGSLTLLEGEGPDSGFSDCRCGVRGRAERLRDVMLRVDPEEHDARED
jgi:hypothetical protein